MEELIKEIKKCLVSFGYRELKPGSNKFGKPISFAIICVGIENDKIVFRTLFKGYSTNETHVYHEKTIDFEYIKEDYSKIKYSIATVEMEMFLDGALVSCGIHDDPFNFLTYTEQVDFLI